MDVFTLCLAFGPIAIYLFLLGAINLSRRPLMVTGARDLAALALALAGLVLIGPMELFFPLGASTVYHAWVWLFLAVLYLLAIVFLLLMLRPRLVIYNIAPAQLRPVLSELAVELDAEARWAGDSLALPNLGVQLHFDSVAALRNITLAAGGPTQSHLGWRKLELALADRLAGIEVPRNRGAIAYLAVASVVVLALLLGIAHDPQAVAQSLFEMLRW